MWTKVVCDEWGDGGTARLLVRPLELLQSRLRPALRRRLRVCIRTGMRLTQRCAGAFTSSPWIKTVGSRLCASNKLGPGCETWRLAGQI